MNSSPAGWVARDSRDEFAMERRGTGATRKSKHSDTESQTSSEDIWARDGQGRGRGGRRYLPSVRSICKVAGGFASGAALGGGLTSLAYETSSRCSSPSGDGGLGTSKQVARNIGVAAHAASSGDYYRAGAAVSAAFEAVARGGDVAYRPDGAASVTPRAPQVEGAAAHHGTGWVTVDGRANAGAVVNTQPATRATGYFPDVL